MKQQRSIRIFLSHASEDKDDFVRALAEALNEKFDVWYDDYSVVVGRSLLRQISEALQLTDYGVVVLSQNFFAKKWPQDELDGLYTLEDAERKLIIPIWHKVTAAEVKAYSAILASRAASNSQKGIEGVVEDIVRSVTYGERVREVSNPLLQKLARAGTTATLNKKFDELGRTAEGVKLVWNELSTLFQIIRDRLSQPVGGLHFRIVEQDVQPPYWIMVYGPSRSDGCPLVLRLGIRKITSNSLTETFLEYMVYFEREEWPNQYKGYDLVHRGELKPYFDQDNQVAWRNAALDIIDTKRAAESAMSEFIDRVQDVLDKRPITWQRVDA